MGRHPDSRAVLCTMCGGKFFPASLPFHQKACMEKAASTYLPCPECNVEFPQATLRLHLQKCRNKRYERQGILKTPKKSSVRRPRGSTPQRLSRSEDKPFSQVSLSQRPGWRGMEGTIASGDSPVSLKAQTSRPSRTALLTGAEEDDGRVPCGVCGRKFNIDRISKHQAICQKSASRRPKFNSTRQRLDGELAQYARRGRSQEKAKPTTNWREKHQDLQSAVRAAKQVAYYQKRGISLAALPPPAPSHNPDYVECPYCSRRYAPTVAERHIPKCKDIINKPKPPPSMRHAWGGSGSPGAAPVPSSRQSSAGRTARAVHSAASRSFNRAKMGSASGMERVQSSFGSRVARFGQTAPQSASIERRRDPLHVSYSAYRPAPRISVSDAMDMTISTLMDHLDSLNVQYADCCEKEELARRLASASSSARSSAHSAPAPQVGYGYGNVTSTSPGRQAGRRPQGMSSAGVRRMMGGRVAPIAAPDPRESEQGSPWGLKSGGRGPANGIRASAESLSGRGRNSVSGMANGLPIVGRRSMLHSSGIGAQRTGPAVITPNHNHNTRYYT